MAGDLGWQPSLLDGGDVVACDPGFGGLERRELEGGAWVDHVPGWVTGADTLFGQVLRNAPWQHRMIRMYDRVVQEPRRVARWDLETQQPPFAGVAEMVEALSDRYGVRFVSLGANLYRDGADSVAWHGDRIARDLPEATIAIVSLGGPRPFRLRPKGGGRSITYLPRQGDLLVMGGSCQRTWDHAVPKVVAAQPRISLQFRHVYGTPG